MPATSAGRSEECDLLKLAGLDFGPEGAIAPSRALVRPRGARPRSFLNRKKTFRLIGELVSTKKTQD